MSQAGILNFGESNPNVPLFFGSDLGTAIALANVINFHGAGGITTSASGNTITITGGTGNVQGPGASIIGDIVLWNNTLGTLVSDAGFGFPLANTNLANSTVGINSGTNIAAPGAISLGSSGTVSVIGPPSATTLTQNGVLFGNAASAIGATAQGAVGTVLAGNGGAAPLFSPTATIPGQFLVYDGTAVNWFTPTSMMYLFDDFIGPDANAAAIGNTNWLNRNTGTGAIAAAHTTVDSGHPGVLELNCGTTTTGSCLIETGQNNNTNWPIILGGGAITVIWVLQLPTLSNGTDTYTIDFGLMNANNGQPIQNGVFFQYTDAGTNAHYFAGTAKASVQTTTDSGVIALAATWTTFQININAAGTSATYFINGSSVATINTNMPTAQIGPNAFILKSAGTTARTMQIDMFYMFQKLTNAR